MSSARILRQAAEALRTRAEAATPGPRSLLTDGCDIYLRAGERGIALFEASLVLDATPESVAHDADYIATMHPGVGLALADWLHDYASWLEVFGQTGRTRENTPALRVADEILGDDA